ncbi:class II aldolase/adducin family protein [Nocardia aurantia]|uniref:L-fuculose phosphate aldolase n=1 Tax=Nocardia aurantia TaxID=2585199 RepID=A0A7K0DJS3_9NOCA|nr:class II aldolase/adducin family protein [Nocardia aurantia]MQY26060.1 L-fuculose phosphate aldolase [Nocardia aurantia]
MTTEIATLRADLAAAARSLAAGGAVHGTAGNLSARAGDTIAVTGTGLVLAEATPEDITLVALDGTRLEGERRPTSEIGIHLGVYRAGDAQAVVHAHSATTVAFTLVADELPVVHYQQLMLGGAIPVVPFAPFGSGELAEATLRGLHGHQAVLMAHHGAVAVGQSLAAAMENLALLDWLCRIYLDAAAVGVPRRLGPADLRAVVEQAVRIGYGNP